MKTLFTGLIFTFGIFFQSAGYSDIVTFGGTASTIGAVAHVGKKSTVDSETLCVTASGVSNRSTGGCLLNNYDTEFILATDAGPSVALASSLVGCWKGNNLNDVSRDTSATLIFSEAVESVTPTGWAINSNIDREEVLRNLALVNVWTAIGTATTSIADNSIDPIASYSDGLYDRNGATISAIDTLTDNDFWNNGDRYGTRQSGLERETKLTR